MLFATAVSFKTSKQFQGNAFQKQRYKVPKYIIRK